MTGRSGDSGSRHPRVVVFDSGGVPQVEVVELPADSGVGDRLLFLGRTWRITAQRESSRVLFAELLEA